MLLSTKHREIVSHIGWYSSSNKVTLPSTDPRTRPRISSRISPVAETVKGQQLALSV
jgi:hypothetical protein